MKNNIDKIEKETISKILKVKNIFKIPKNVNMKIIFEKTYQEEPFQKELDQRVQLLKNINKNNQKEKINKVLNLMQSLHGFEKKIFKNFTNNEEYELITTNDILIEKKKQKKINYENIYYGFELKKNSSFYKNQKNNIKKYQNLNVYYIISSILYSYNYLNKEGSCLYKISIPDIRIIDTLYYLNFIFNEVYIIDKFIVFCKGFKKDINQIENLKNIIKNNYEFIIKNKKNEKKLINYLKNIIKLNTFYKKKLILNHSYKLYILYTYISIFYCIYNTKNYLKKENNSKNKIKKNLKLLFLNKIYNLKNNNNLNYFNINFEDKIINNNNLFINEIINN